MTLQEPDGLNNAPDGATASRIGGGYLLPRTGRVVEVADDPGQPAHVVDEHGERVTDFDGFLQHAYALGSSRNTVVAYANDLLRWHRLLTSFGVTVTTAARSEVRDLVSYLKSAPNPQRRRGADTDAPAAGTYNRRTGKQALPEGYSARTINRQLSVLSSFYTWRLEEGLSLVNPVPQSRSARRTLVAGQPAARPNAHHDPTRPFRHGQRAPYRQPVTKRRPRNIRPEHQRELFEGTNHRRDWAVLFALLWTAIRASELLSLTPDSCDRDRFVLHVVGEGLAGATREVPVPAEFFVFLDAYLDDLAEAGVTLRPHDPLWWTVAPGVWPRPLRYGSLRSWFRRANARLGLNYTLHDTRHTALRRMVNDTKNFTIVDVAAIAGHVSVETTQIYTEPTLDDLVVKTQQHHVNPLPDVLPAEERPVYDQESLRTLFGGQA